MSWWTSLVDGAKSVKDTVGNVAQWIWDYTLIPKAAVNLAAFTANTTFYTLEQILALRTGVPALFKTPESRNVLKHMVHVVTGGIAPVLIVSAANNLFQNYFRQEDENANLLRAGGLIAINTLVSLYAIRQGMQTLTHILVLNIVAPRIMSANREIIPATHCKGGKCDTKRRLAGNMAEPFLIIANDVVGLGIGIIPCIGRPLSIAWNVSAQGRWLVRAITPERCASHKGIVPAHALALGIILEGIMIALNSQLESTIGRAPFLQERAIRLFVTLFCRFMFMHANVPYSEMHRYLNVIGLNEALATFGINVVVAGLKVRIPKDWKPDPNAAPIFELSEVFRFGTRLLSSDRQIPTSPSGVLGNASHFFNKVALPPIFHDPYNDPIIRKHWAEIRKGAIGGLALAQAVRTNTVVSVLAYAPKSVATLVKMQTGISKSVTRLMLSATRDEDLWDFIRVAEFWFRCHGAYGKVLIVPRPTLAPLVGDTQLLPAPERNLQIEGIGKKLLGELPPALLTASPKKQRVAAVAELLVNQPPSKAPAPPQITDELMQVSEQFRMTGGVRVSKVSGTMFSKKTKGRPVIISEELLQPYTPDP